MLYSVFHYTLKLLPIIIVFQQLTIFEIRLSVTAITTCLLLLKNATQIIMPYIVNTEQNVLFEVDNFSVSLPNLIFSFVIRLHKRFCLCKEFKITDRCFVYYIIYLCANVCAEYLSAVTRAAVPPRIAEIR